MSQNTSEILIDTLISWGIDAIFGVPGDGNNGIVEILRRRQDKIRFIQTRHEETAAFMACAYAKFTGRLGACIATSGPGAIHLLNGLYDAKLDGQPVIAITGNTAHDLMDTHFQQDVALDRLFQDACVYSARAMGPSHIKAVADIACRTARARRGPAHVTVPFDFQEMPLDRDSLSMHNVSPYHTSSVSAEESGIPGDEDLARAAEVLNSGRRIAILVGRGALGATIEVEEAAEKLGAPVIKALLGKAVLPDDSPYTTGGIGLLGTMPSYEAMQECDTLLILGSTFPYMEYLPKPGLARAVQVDIDPARIGLRYPVEVGIAGSVKAALQRLICMLPRKEDRSFLLKSRERMAAWRRLMDERAAGKGLPLRPQTVMAALSERLSDQAVVSADCGINCFFWAQHVNARRGQIHTVSGTLSTMACALPYTLAAQVAYPGRQCVAIAGDGGFSMLMQDFVTAVKYNLPVRVVVLKNNSLAQIKWEQLMFLGNPEYAVDLQPIDYVKFAEACGGTGVHIEKPEECGGALDSALSARGPVIIEAVVDSLEPIVPPLMTEQFRANYRDALRKGEADADRIGSLVQQREKELAGVR